MTALALSLPAVRPRMHRLKGRVVSKDEAASMMGVAVGKIDDWVALGAPVKEYGPDRRAEAFDCTALTDWLLRADQIPPPPRTDEEPLPPSAQEIADVIGRDRALILIGQLPPCGGRSWRVCLYVPSRIGPDHPLVKMIGWRDANLLVQEFGGIILMPSNCRFLHRQFRAKEIMRLHGEGWPDKRIADVVEISARQVRNIINAAEAAS